MLKHRRVRVNDLVFGFCHRIRHPKNTGLSVYDFLLLPPAQHVDFDIVARGNMWKQYTPFIAYAQKHGTGSLAQVNRAMSTLEMYTACWRAEDFAYAAQLFATYYGIGGPTNG